MKSALVLGAGLVTRPHVEYLLKHGFKVIVASRTVSKAEKLVNGHNNGVAKAYDITKDDDLSGLREIIKDVDIAISLLPYAYHVKVAEVCIELKKHLVTTSYVSDSMQALDEKAKAANVLLLNECGLDPGIDHMSAQEIIDNVHAENGKILSFSSYCGGLPSHYRANPYGYKLSWSPRGFLLAGTNTAKFLKDGKELEIPGKELFTKFEKMSVEGIEYEGYPNRNSVPYREIYNFPEAQDIIRGTLRYGGHCDRFLKKANLGILSDKKQSMKDLTFKQLIMQLIGSNDSNTVQEDTAKFLDIALNSSIIADYAWLGLFDDRKIPFDEGSPLDALEHLVIEKLQYTPGERDAVILHHTFIVEKENGSKEKITSTLIDYGIPEGDTSMSRTVGLPAAIAVRLILGGKVPLTGVYIPNEKILYEPILAELKTMNIAMVEKSFPM